MPSTLLAMRLLLAVLAASSGLFGTVTKSPTMPVCMVGQPCSAPVAGTTLAFSRGGHVVARTRTSAAGRYRVRLAAGTYGVSTVPRVGVGMTPRTIVVPRGSFRRANFAIDTGIR